MGRVFSSFSSTMVFERIPVEIITNPAVLGAALQFRNGRVAKNRFMKAAMTEKIAVWDEDPKKRGIPTERIINLYEKWGNGGFGLILTGNVAVDPYHLEAAGNVIISRENDSPELRENLRRFAQSTKSDGALAVVQLTHAGRQTPIGVYSTPFSASDVQLAVKGYLGFGKPVPLTLEQIKTEVIDRFVYSATIAYEAGFDGVQIHGAHGYLLSQFMSPTTNKRTDQYGGPPENRVRIVLEIFDAIRKEIPAETGFLIGIKTNSVEFQEQGLQTNDAKIMCRLMEEKGFDFVELSGGTMEKFAFSHERESTKKREAYFLEFTDQIKPVFKKTIVYVTGGFRTVSGMTSAVKNGSTDGIGLGRPVAAEPDLPKKILSGEVASSSDDKFQQDNFGLTAVAAMSQMAAMGKRSLKELNGRVEGDIPDFSNPQESKNYLERFAEHMALVSELMKEQKPVPGVLEYTALEVVA